MRVGIGAIILICYKVVVPAGQRHLQRHYLESEVKCMWTLKNGQKTQLIHYLHPGSPLETKTNNEEEIILSCPFNISSGKGQQIKKVGPWYSYSFGTNIEEEEEDTYPSAQL